MRFSVPIIPIYCVSLLVCFLTTGCALFRFGEPPEQPAGFGEQLDRILKGKGSNTQAALDTLLSGKTMPVCEGGKCFFFYKAAADRAIAVAGDWNAWDTGVDMLQPIPKTDYYFLTKEFPPNARLDYRIVDSGKWIVDPRNPRTCEGQCGPNSELAMPGYRVPEELNVPDDVPEGVMEELVFESEILSGTRALSVYLPPDYGREYGPHPFLIVQDGVEFIRLAHFPRVVDYLVHQQKIRRVVLVFVEPADRNVDYESEKYSRFIAEELIPYLRANYDVCKDRENCGIMGASLGALAAFRTALKYPEVFGKVAGQSVCFGTDDQLFQAVQNGSGKTLQFYFDVGLFETNPEMSLLTQSRRMRDLLAAQGCAFTYNEHPEGHSWGNWRAHLDDILLSFWPRNAV